MGSTHETLKITVASELCDDLRRQADDEGIAMSELLRHAIALHLFVHQQQNRDDNQRRTGKRLVRLARRAVGSGATLGDALRALGRTPTPRPTARVCSH